MASTVGSAVTGDTALKQKVLSTPEVLAQSVANMAPSAAMALLPLFVFYSAGNALWLSFALGLVVLLIVGYCAAQFASRINSAGSFYVWVTRGLGPAAGHAAGWGLVLGYLFTGVATVLGFEIYGDQFLTGLGLSPGNHAARAVLYVVGGLGPTLVAILDIRISQRSAFILEAVSVTIILILCVAVYVHKAAWWTRPSSPSAGSSQAAWWSGWCWLSSPSSGSKAPAPWVKRPGTPPAACPAPFCGAAAWSACST